MTFTDPKPGFIGHGIFEVEYLKNNIARAIQAGRGHRSVHGSDSYIMDVYVMESKDGDVQVDG